MPICMGGWEAGPGVVEPALRITGGREGSAIKTGSDALAVVPVLSFTVTDTGNVPGAVGVPERLVPLALATRFTPPGSPLAVQMYGGTPPVVTRATE